ncbi:hypothetical protein SASPL_137579 [Salvia splendens]|uniref:Sulfite oxidase n=1 Tax=Salvia splendens TaxID=180675 RepID=A0A8X8ZD25_SALSN|nr:hypothetical protein SASPL_137579 [Salvia splendens]
MSKTRPVKGVGWDVGAIGNGYEAYVLTRDFMHAILAVWGGAKLADVLALVGIPNCSRVTPSGQKHVEFEENGGPYTASIPLIQATNPESVVLLAYEMNGETLNRDHGFPLRVIVPGVIGARSVKWLDSINIIVEECQGFFMQRDYKMFPPSVDWNNISWPTRRPQMDFPVQSAICSLEDANLVKPGTFPTPTDRDLFDKWAWVLFEAEANIPQSTEIVAKAVDVAGNVQPENVDVIRNLMGILNTSWHRVQVRIGHSNL